MVLSKSMRRLSLLPCLCLLPLGANAQISNGGSSFIEVNPIFNVNGGNSVMLDLKYGKNWAVNEVISCGFSVGLIEELHFNTWKPNIPILLRGTFEMNQKEFSPFLSIDMGYNVCTEHFKYGSLIVNPTAGVRVKNYYVGVGYLASVGLSGGSGTGHNINVRGGYYFNSGKGAMSLKSFFKRTYVTAEVGGGLSMSKYYNSSFYGDRDENSEMSNKSALVNFNWLYEIDEHWSAGIGTGAMVFFHTEKNDDYDGGSSSEVTTAIPVYARGQYVFSEKGNSVRPFVACNLGMCIDMGSDWDKTNSGFLFEPQAGVIFNDKYSLSLGYEPSAAYYRWGGRNYDGDDESVAEKFSQVTLRLGIKL